MENKKKITLNELRTLVKKIIKEGAETGNFSSYDASDTPGSYKEYPSEKEVVTSDIDSILKKYKLYNTLQPLQNDIHDLNIKIHDICEKRNGYFEVIDNLIDNLTKDVKDENLIKEILIKFYTIYIDDTIHGMTKEGFLRKFL
jgi:hypothetical protein